VIAKLQENIDEKANADNTLCDDIAVGGCERAVFFSSAYVGVFPQ
jgi:hypothetical protein